MQRFASRKLLAYGAVALTAVGLVIGLDRLARHLGVDWIEPPAGALTADAPAPTNTSGAEPSKKIRGDAAALDLLAANARDRVPRLDGALSELKKPPAAPRKEFEEVAPVVPIALESSGGAKLDSPSPQPYWRSAADLAPALPKKRDPQAGPFEPLPVPEPAANEAENLEVARAGEIETAPAVTPAPTVPQPEIQEIPESVGRLVGLDVDGVTHHIVGSPEIEAAAIVFLRADEASARILSPLKRMADAYRAKRIAFFGVFAEAMPSRTAAEEFRRTTVLNFPLLVDSTGELRRQLRPSHTPQAFVVSRAGQVVYAGLIDGRQDKKAVAVRKLYLADALRAFAGGQPIRTSRTTASGTLLEPALEIGDLEVTYSQHVAPLLQMHCTSCHREGGEGPFSLALFEDASAHASEIVTATQTRAMPPQESAEHTAIVQGLSDAEIALLARWVETGTLLGDPAEIPPIPKSDAEVVDDSELEEVLEENAVDAEEQPTEEMPVEDAASPPDAEPIGPPAASAKPAAEPREEPSTFGAAGRQLMRWLKPR